MRRPGGGDGRRASGDGRIDLRIGQGGHGLRLLLPAPTSPGTDLDSDERPAWLATPAGRPGEFLWLHFNLANTAIARWIEQHLTLPDAFREAAGANSSTRVESPDDFLLAVINDVLFYAFDASSASTLTICVDSPVLVSARITPLRSVDRLRASVKRGETFRSPVELLAHLLRDQADVLVQIVRDATAQVDDDRGQADRPRRDRRAARSSARSGGRSFACSGCSRPSRRPSSGSSTGRRPWITADDVRDLRQSAEELSAAVADSVALVERVRLLQEELVALVNEQTSRTLFVLTIVTVLALPMTIIPGFFGMNVGGVPFGAHARGFWLVVVLVAAVVGSGALWALRDPSKLRSARRSAARLKAAPYLRNHPFHVSASRERATSVTRSLRRRWNSVTSSLQAVRGSRPARASDPRRAPSARRRHAARRSQHTATEDSRMTFFEALAEQRWDDHRYYHHNRINQALHLVSALSFIAAYALLFVEPVAAVLLGWLVAMPSRQIGHFFFEPQDYDAGQPGDPRIQGRDQGRLQPAPQGRAADDLGPVAAAPARRSRRCSACCTPHTGWYGFANNVSVDVAGARRRRDRLPHACTCSSCATSRPGWCGPPRSSPTRFTT